MPWANSMALFNIMLTYDNSLLYTLTPEATNQPIPESSQQVFLKFAMNFQISYFSKDSIKDPWKDCFPWVIN